MVVSGCVDGEACDGAIAVDGNVRVFESLDTPRLILSAAKELTTLKMAAPQPGKASLLPSHIMVTARVMRGPIGGAVLPECDHRGAVHMGATRRTWSITRYASP